MTRSPRLVVEVPGLSARVSGGSVSAAARRGYDLLLNKAFLPPDFDQQTFDELWKTCLSAAMAAGATVSHHHGIGLLKARALAEQLGDARRMVHGLKRALDPDGIMNPGKLLP